MYTIHIFLLDLIQSSCKAILLAVLEKCSIRDIQLVKHLQPLKKMFGLSLLRGQDKNTYNRALAAALLNNSYVSFTDGSDLANLTIKDIKIL